VNDPKAIVPVILSGGMGTRLWPASRRTRPKQLLNLVGDRSLIRATVDRINAVSPGTTPIIVTNADHADAIEQDLKTSGSDSPVLMLEPVGRNTAPAVAVAAHEIISTRGDGLMIVLPSDHTISNEAVFAEAIEHAASAARDGFLVTFGITPSHAETGYGYIKVGTAVSDATALVSEFREKPDEETAESYITSGDYLWNSGMYLFMASRYLEELRLHAPDIAASAKEAYAVSTRDRARISLGAEAFAACRSDSIDYAVMESTESAAVVPTDPGWNDVGSWSSLWDISEKDGARNVTLGNIELADVTGSYIRGDHRLIAVVGLDDVVIVDTPDALLVTTREKAQDVKSIVDRLQADNRPELD
jgi:mannose-1-phosphate guanylyltransferase/mannose-6-phosphate isomerase